MKMTKVFLAAASLAALPVAAQAQINAQPGIYVGAGGGLSWGIGSNSNASTSTGFAFGGQVGYDCARGFKVRHRQPAANLTRLRHLSDTRNEARCRGCSAATCYLRRR